MAHSWQPNGHLKSPNVTASSIPPISAFQTTFSSYAKPTSLSLYSCNLTAAISVQAPASSLLPFLPSKSLRFQFVSSISLIFSLFFIGFEHRNPTFHSISGLSFSFFFHYRRFTLSLFLDMARRQIVGVENQLTKATALIDATSA